MLSIKDKGKLLQIVTHCEGIEEIVWNTAKTNIKDLHKYIIN